MSKVKFLAWTPARLVKEYERRRKSPLIETSPLAKDILDGIERLGTDERMEEIWESLFNKDADGFQDYFVDSILKAVEEAYCLTDVAAKDLETPAKQRDKLLKIAEQTESLIKSLEDDATAYRVGMGSVRRVVDERWLKERALISNEIDPETGKSSIEQFEAGLVASDFDDEWSSYRTYGEEIAKRNLVELEDSALEGDQDPLEISNGIETMAWHAIAARRLGVDEVLDRLSKDLKHAALQLERPSKDLIKNLIPRLQDVIQVHLGKPYAKEIAYICSVVAGREWGEEIDPKHVPRNYK